MHITQGRHGVSRWAAWALILALLTSGATSAQVAEPDASLVLDTPGHVGPIRRVAADGLGHWVVTVSDDKSARVWRAADGRTVRTLRVPVGTDEVGRLYGVAISPDGAHVAIGGTTAMPGKPNRIFVFALASGVLLRTIDAKGQNIRRLLWTPDGQAIVASYVGEPALRVFGNDGQLRFEAALPADSYGLSMTREGQLAVTSFDGRVRLYRVGPAGVVAERELSVGLRDLRFGTWMFAAQPIPAIAERVPIARSDQRPQK